MPTAVPTPAPALTPRVVAPSTRSTPVPATSTNTAQPTYVKPVPIRPKSRLSPDMVVDIMSEDGSHDVPAAMPRDQESEEIVKQLEKGLPPWPGFGEEGWSEDINQVGLVYVGLDIADPFDIENRNALSRSYKQSKATKTSCASYNVFIAKHLFSSIVLSVVIGLRQRLKLYRRSQQFLTYHTT